MNTETVPDQVGVFSEVASGLASGMPTFQRVQFDFANGADLRQWAARFGIDIPATAGQPYPNPGLVDPSQVSEWLITEYREWRGMSVILHSREPITDEQCQHWIDSGQAADHIKFQAEKAAREAGLDYSRADSEPDDPTPVSPARAPLHVGVVEDGGLVEVATEAYQTARCGDLAVHGPHAVDHGPDQPRNCPGVPVPTDEATPAETATLSAAIHFSEARRDAGRALGRWTTPELLQAATLNLLHGQAFTEDVERALCGGLREGEQGRVANPNLAHFLAIKEERKRIARHFLGLEESAKHSPFVTRDCCGYGPAAEHNPDCMGELTAEAPTDVPLHGGPCWTGCMHEANR